MAHMGGIGTLSWIDVDLLAAPIFLMTVKLF